MSAPVTFSDPQAAFEAAIKAGRLSTDPTAPNYAGAYMYMGHAAEVQLELRDGRTVSYPRAQFKRIDTRQYLP